MTPPQVSQLKILFVTASPTFHSASERKRHKCRTALIKSFFFSPNHFSPEVSFAAKKCSPRRRNAGNGYTSKILMIAWLHFKHPCLEVQDNGKYMLSLNYLCSRLSFSSIQACKYVIAKKFFKKQNKALNNNLFQKIKKK